MNLIKRLRAPIEIGASLPCDLEFGNKHWCIIRVVCSGESWQEVHVCVHKVQSHFFCHMEAFLLTQKAVSGENVKVCKSLPSCLKQKVP